MVSRWDRYTGSDRDLPPEGQDSAGHVRAASRCEEQGCAEQERSLLVLYALQSCLDDEANDFEAHLLGCEACFEDLKALDRARTLVQEALAGDPAVLQRIREALSGYRRSLGAATRPPSSRIS